MHWSPFHRILVLLFSSLVFLFFMSPKGVGDTLTSAGIFFGLVTFTAGLFLKSVSDVGVSITTLNKNQRSAIFEGLNEYRKNLLNRICRILVSVVLMIVGGNFLDDNNEWIKLIEWTYLRCTLAICSGIVLTYTVSSIIAMFSEYNDSENQRIQLTQKLQDEQPLE